MLSKTLRLLAASAALAFGWSSPAAILYFEGFDSPNTGSGDGDPFALYNWATHRGQNGAITLNGNPDWPGNPVASNTGGQARVVDDPGGPPSPSDRTFLFWSADNDEDLLSWTGNFSSLLTSSYTGLSLSFFHRNSNGSGGVSEPGNRAAVAISTGNTTRWFATGTRNTNTTANWVQVSANLSSTDWIEFTFNGTQGGNATAGFDVSGAPGALPSGSLVALGIYSEMEANGISSGDSVRFDSVLLEGTFIPEPAGVGFLACATGLALLRRRRAP